MKKAKLTKDRKLILSRVTPRESAELFREREMPTLINQQGEWLLYRGGAYYEIEHATIHANVSTFLENACVLNINKKTGKPQGVLKFNPKQRDVSEVLDALKAISHRDRDALAPPCFLDGAGELADLDPKKFVSCGNGLLYLPTRALYPATSNYFTRTVLPLDFDPSAPEPMQWLEFLAEVTGGRQHLIDLMQEIIGYLLSGETRMQRVFFFVGNPRAGKGTVLRIVNALLGGERNVTSPTIQDLAGRFGYAPLIGKTLAQITDMDCENASKLGVAANRINAISGEDAISADRKNNPVMWEGHLRCRIVLAGNHLPNFRSHTGAMAARLLILPFEQSFEGREDYGLTDKLESELPGIMNWALEGLDRLNERGRFAEPEESKALKRELIYKSNSVLGFVNEWCIVDPGAEIEKTILLSAYNDYAAALGKPNLSANTFAEYLREATQYKIEPRRPTIRGERTYTFAGIKLRDAIAQHYFKSEADELARECGWLPALVLRDGYPIPLSPSERAAVEALDDFGEGETRH